MNAPQIDLDLVYYVDPSDYAWSQSPDPRIKQAAEWIARHFNLQRLYASIAIVDDPTMQSLNAERLGHDWPTDVISFEIDRSPTLVEGEVIASAETASRVSRSAGWPAEDELLLFIVHGLLHVAGMDDLEDQEQQHMRQTEQACLLALGVSRADRHVQRFDSVCDSEAGL